MGEVIDMGGCRFGVARKRWELPFLAEVEELAGLRRVMRLHLELWGLHPVVHSAQICVTELVGNVIKHVGVGTPTCLAVSMNGGHLRIEVSDPDGQALPTLVKASGLAEGGRGMALVDGVAARWGVILRGGSKITWCELATGLQAADDHVDGAPVAKAEALLGLCGLGGRGRSARHEPLSVTEAAEAATDLIADLLHWLRGHGFDIDEALDRAQLHFEAEIEVEVS
ncbi:MULTISPECIES: ATP-binding protein [unclassified Streptomyces]|uniref:ATP-binding protein n=1 Tax=unclassified Streptomyces TaxID=2593676 RepID=UPI0036E26F10